MAGRAGGHGENVRRRRMLRIRRLLPGRQMALRVAAIGRLDLEIEVAVNVAGSAGQIRVSVG